MDQESIMLAILLKQDRLDAKAFVDFSDRLLEQLFDEKFEEVSYSLLINNKLKSKSLVYSTKNIQKLYDEPCFNGFELLKLLPNWKYKSMDVHFSARYTPEFDNKNSLIVLTINKESFLNRYRHEKLIEIYSSMVNFLIASNALPIYGFIFSMNNSKFPTMFIAGVGNYDMNKKEEEELQRWAERSNEADTSIWNIFWANLVTINHFKSPQGIKDLESFVGKASFWMLNESTFLFKLPNNNLSFDIDEDSWRSKISQLFTIMRLSK